jgi:peptidyl-dipeptidase A
MWAQKWDNIYRLLQPFKNRELIDVTQELVRQNYTVERMFRTAESFFTSLGMDKMTDKFWKHSMIRKPSGRNALCHAAAYDLFAENDFR